MAAFGQTNYHRTSTKSIAEAAGVSEALIFQHFSTKQELFLESLRRASNELNDELERILSDHLSDPLAAFARAYLYFADYLNRSPEYGRLVLSALSETQEDGFRTVIRENIERAETILTTWIQRGIEDRIFRTDVNVDVAKWIFVSGYHYMIVAKQLGRLPQADPELMNAVLGPLLAERSRPRPSHQVL